MDELQSYTYLIVNLASISIPFLFSFHPRLLFYKEWKTFLPALFIVASVFIAWDILYTDWGVWGFNPDYLTGIYIFNLPLEEILFFICIPYACAFSYHCFKVLIPQNTFSTIHKYISFILISASALLIVFFPTNLYTTVTFGLLLISMIFFTFYLKPKWMGMFYFSYMIMLIPFFIVNGILTGTGLESPIVWYDDNQNIGFRLLTIPVEDIFYGFLLILYTIAIFEYFKARKLKINE